MIFDWFKIFNLTEFEDLELVSKDYEMILGTKGRKEFIVTKGNYVSVTIDDVVLPIQLNDQNPYSIDDIGVYIDENDDVWVGYLVES